MPDWFALLEGLTFGQLLVVRPDRLAKLREPPLHARPAARDVGEMGAVGRRVGEDVLAHRRQALGFLSPVRVLRRLGDRHIEIAGRVFEKVAPVHVPFDGGKPILDLLSCRDMELVSLDLLDQGRPCIVRDVRIFREPLEPRDQAGVAPGIEQQGAALPGVFAERVPIPDKRLVGRPPGWRRRGWRPGLVHCFRFRIVRAGRAFVRRGGCHRNRVPLPSRGMALVIFEHTGEGLPGPGRQFRLLRQRAHARDQEFTALHIECRNAGLACTIDEPVPIPPYRLIECVHIGPGR